MMTATEVIKQSSEVHMRRNSKSELDDTLHFFAAGSWFCCLWFYKIKGKIWNLQKEPTLWNDCAGIPLILTFSRHKTPKKKKKKKNRPRWGWKQGRWQQCLRQLKSNNTASYPHTHSNAQESHFSCGYSQEAWRSAGSHNNKALGVETATRYNQKWHQSIVQPLKPWRLTEYNIELPSAAFRSTSQWQCYRQSARVAESQGKRSDFDS